MELIAKCDEFEIKNFEGSGFLEIGTPDAPYFVYRPNSRPLALSKYTKKLDSSLRSE